MAGRIEESKEFFLEQVFANETLLQSERKEIIRTAMLSLVGGITDGSHKWGLSMTVGKLGHEAKLPRMNSRGEKSA